MLWPGLQAVEPMHGVGRRLPINRAPALTTAPLLTTSVIKSELEAHYSAKAQEIEPRLSLITRIDRHENRLCTDVRFGQPECPGGAASWATGCTPGLFP